MDKLVHKFDAAMAEVMESKGYVCNSYGVILQCVLVKCVLVCLVKGYIY